MSTAARRRLMRDFKVRHYGVAMSSPRTTEMFLDFIVNKLQRMQTDPPAGVSASPIADNVMTWYGSPHPPHTRHCPELSYNAQSYLSIVQARYSGNQDVLATPDTDSRIGTQSSSAQQTPPSKMEPSASLCTLKRHTQTSHRASSSLARCSTPTYTGRGSCVWTSYRTDGRPRTMSQRS
jgi:hypothetical protein